MVTNSAEQFPMGAWARGAVVFSAFVLRAPTAQITRVLHLTGTDQVFTIEPAD